MDGRVKLLIVIWALMITVDCALCQPDSLWSRRYDMTIGGSMLAHDGSYVFSGWSINNDTVLIRIAKLDSEGEIIWENSRESIFKGIQMVETPDTGFAICRYHEDDIWIVKYNLEGEELYSWQFELEFEPDIRGFLSDGEGGYIACGHTSVNNNFRNDFVLLKVSAEGELEWQEVFVERRDQYCFGMTAVPDGGFMLVGNNKSVNNFANEVNVIRTDVEGEIIWRNHYGTEFIDIPANETGYDIIATNDGNFVVAGHTLPHEEGSDFDVLMLKIDSDGDVIWLKTIDLGINEKARSITKTMDGGFVMSGFSSENFDITGNPFIMKTDHRGNMIWSYVEENVSVGGVGDVIAHEDRTFSLIINMSQGGARPGFLQKFGRDPHGVADGGSGFLPIQSGLVAAYPNPFNGITTFVFTVGSPADVEINIFNTLGRRQTELVRRSYPAGQHNISWDAGGLPSGDYFARMTAGGRVSTRKVSLVK